MSFKENNRICVRCPHRQRPPVHGRCACLADPERRDIQEHAKEGVCPLDYFASPPPHLAQRIAHAAVGVIKAQTGTGGAGKELIDRRTAICQTCDKAQIRAGVFHQCTVCGCSTWHKVRNESEKCPMGKW